MAGTIEVPGNDRGDATGRELRVDVHRSRVLAELVAERLGARTSAPVRSSFISQSTVTGEPPPLARMMRGGRGGEVKLKVLLSVLWVAVSEPYDVRTSARVWAELIGLPDPSGNGAVRVQAALRQLVKTQHLRREATVGEASRFFLLEETGTGAAYENPGKRVSELREAGEDFSSHRYFQVPGQLWTNGWLSLLGGPGLAMLLVLLAQASGRDHRDIWFSPGVADERYHLSEETRKRGLDQLAALGLVTIRRRPISRDAWEPTRLRNTYTLNLDRLRKTLAPDPEAGTERAPRSRGQRSRSVSST